MTVELTLPMPPSVNALWLNIPGKGRVRSKVYRSWKKAAGWELAIQRPKKITGNYNITILVSELRKGSDIANREKGISDLLQEHGVIDNDSLARDVRLKWDETIKDGYVKIILEAA